MDEEVSSRRDARQFEQYKVGENEHISALKPVALLRIARKLQQQQSESDWIALASELGVDDDATMRGVQARLREGRCTDSATHEVLLEWGKKPGSTVRVLRQVLKKMGRNDVVTQLDRYLYDMVNLTIVLKSEGGGGREAHDLSGECPGRMPLIDYVRPQVSRKMSTQLMNAHLHRESIVIKMHRRPAQCRLEWTTTAKSFQSQELTLLQEVVELEYSAHRFASGNYRRRRDDTGRIQPLHIVERLAVSEVFVDVNLFFEYRDENDEDVTENDSDSSPSTSSEGPTQEQGSNGELAEQEVVEPAPVQLRQRDNAVAGNGAAGEGVVPAGGVRIAAIFDVDVGLQCDDVDGKF